MKINLKKTCMLVMIIALASCNKNKDSTGSEVRPVETVENEKSVEAVDSNDCLDKNEAIQNWRSACSTASAMAGASNSNSKIWCSCVENKYDVRKYSESKYCLFPSPTRLFPRLWQDDDIIVQCGTANKPI